MKRNFLAFALMVMCTYGAFAQSWSKDLEKSAKGGDVAAQLAVGTAYLNGDGVKANPKKAAQWLNQASAAGNEDAKKKLCTFYSKELETMAIAGDADAQCAVGKFYADGNGVKANPTKAGDWLYKALKQGNADAKAKLLTFFSNSLVQLACDNDADAQYALAGFYFECKADETDKYSSKKRGESWLGDAAVNGHVAARAKVLEATSYSDESLEKLAKSGDAEAAWKLANLWLADESRPGMLRAADYLMIAAKGGNTKASEKMMALSNAYIKGRGVDQDEQLGYYFLSKAAAAGYKKAVEQFYGQDSKALRNAADNGDVDAMLALCKLDASYETRYKYYVKAFKAGREDVIWNLLAEVPSDYASYQCRIDGFSAPSNSNAIPNIETAYIKDQDIAYIAAFYEFKKNNSKSIATGLSIIKRLKSYGHKLSTKLYDEELFVYDYEQFDIIKPDINDENQNTLIGLKGHNSVIFNGKVIESTEPTAKEIEDLTAALPDFSIGASKIRCIRDLEFTRTGRDSIDIQARVTIYYLPGLAAIGPSLYKISYKGKYIRFNEDVFAKYVLLDNKQTIKAYPEDLKVRMIDQSTGKASREFGRFCTISSDTIKGFSLAGLGFRPTYTLKNGVPMFNLNNNTRARISDGDGATTELWISNNEYYSGWVVKYITRARDGSTCTFDPDQQFAFTFTKPDGTYIQTKFPDYNAVSDGLFTLSMLDIHNNLNAAYVDKLAKELYYTNTKDGERFYGMDKATYDDYLAKQAQIDKANSIKKYNQDLKNLYAQYRKEGYSAADVALLQNNAKTILEIGPFVKGLNIKLVAHYRSKINDLRRDIWKYDSDNEYGVVFGNFELRYEWDDNTASYYFTGTWDDNSYPAIIYTKNGYITNWVKIND